MHPHERLITDFYVAFAARDAGGMGACYHDDVVFSDPVFPTLRGDEARGMWHMLCERGKDLEVVASAIRADGDSGSAHWDARYTFSGTGRKVFNRVDATFRFRDGKIIEHRDDFSLWAWTRMALGPTGWLLGWTPIVRGKIRKQAGGQLRSHLANEP